ncbi:hybrid-cluster NAD(P)-dependent oxidoreductase [Nocardioides salsibiostraticola]
MTHPLVEPVETPVEDSTSLHLVPDLPAAPPRPLGDGVLPSETSIDQEFGVRRRIQVTHDVVTLVLEPKRPQVFAYSPGQYLTLRVEVEGVLVERCYTISSPPTRPHLLTITVKRLDGGALSPFLHDRLVVGDRVSAVGPLGRFTVAAHPSSKLLLLSAGSGITPTLSTVRAMADLGDLDADGVDVVVVHSARTPDDLVCRPELEALAATYAGLRVVWVCEEDSSGTAGMWAGWRGRLDETVLMANVSDIADREVFTCGPPGYMAAVHDLLGRVGADPERCHQESFVIGAAAGSTPESILSNRSGTAVSTGFATIRFGRSGREALCAPGTTVLAAAASVGVNLPSSCGEGLCGTCKVSLLSGRVDMDHQGGIRPREIAANKFLPCCSTPDGDIVVDA